MDKNAVLDFIKEQKLMVISSTNENGKPESAVVGFGQTDNFEIVFGTNTSTRKYKNINTNPTVSLVIGWDKGRTVQFEGNAEELNDVEFIRKHYWRKNPWAESFHDEPGQCYMLVKPKWIRYTDISKKPQEVVELSF